MKALSALLVSPLLLLAACGAPMSESTESPSESTSPYSCDKDSLKTVTPGRFTIGTDDPAHEPWFVGNEPSNGQGYEAAVGLAVATELGFSRHEITWVSVPFNEAVAPGKKSFDIDLNQVSFSAARRKAVDFSSGYYDVTQAVITYLDSSIEHAGSVTGLKRAKLGAQVGTTSYTAITDQIEPVSQPRVFDTNDLAAQALKNKQVDGIVVDLPTAYVMTRKQVKAGVIVGQLPTRGQGEQFGAVLAKGSPLTPCVTAAVDSLRTKGTLTSISNRWLSQRGAPLLS